jgi:hypothetical protein
MGGEVGPKAKATANGDVTSHPALAAKPAIHIIVLVRRGSHSISPSLFLRPGTPPAPPPLLSSRTSPPQPLHSSPLPLPQSIPLPRPPRAAQRDCASPPPIHSIRLAHFFVVFFWFRFRGSDNHGPSLSSFSDGDKSSRPRVSTLGRGLGPGHPDLLFVASFRRRTRPKTKPSFVP